MKSINKQYISAVAAAVIIFNFSACKYEDGPKISLLSKKARLSGNWELVKINGKKVSDIDVEMEFEKKGDITIDYVYQYNGSNYNYSSQGEWQWEEGKEVIDVDFKDWHEEYTVKKLTNSELIIEDSYGEEWELEKN